VKSVRFACENKAIKTMFLALLIIFCFSSATVSAWMPDRWFQVLIDSKKIPEGTAYIDLLMPISSADEGYVVYNESNGEKYGISENSGIVNYCEDGFVSYTFHIVDADSSIQPTYTFSFCISDDDYIKNKDFLQRFDNSYQRQDGNRQYECDVTVGSETEKKLLEIKDDLIEMKSYFFRTEYNSPLERESKYDFDYCREKYKYAKMAYLDKNGNVISVSEAAKIKSRANKEAQVQLTLSGNEFNSEIDTGPNIILAIVIYMTWPFIVLMIIIIIVSRIKIKKIRNSSVKKH